MKITSERSFHTHCILCFICCFCLLQTKANAQAADSTLHHKWGIEVGYGLTEILRVDGRSMAWRPQVGVVFSHAAGRKNALSYALRYRPMATNLLNDRSTNIDFLSASISFNRLVLKDKIIVGAGVLGEYKLKEYIAVKAADGTITKSSPPSGFNTYNSFNWGGIITCQVPIKLNNKLSIRTGLTYSFTVRNFVSTRLLEFASSHPTGLWFTTSLYIK
jgi:hypothetical protein